MKALKLFILTCMLAFAASASAQSYDKGMIDGQYAIRFHENYNPANDKISGKYAYENIIKKYGNKPENYLTFTGYQSYEKPGGVQHLTIYDPKGNVVEYWILELHSGHGKCWATGTVTFASGKRKGERVKVYIDMGAM